MDVKHRRQYEMSRGQSPMTLRTMWNSMFASVFMALVAPMLLLRHGALGTPDTGQRPNRAVA